MKKLKLSGLAGIGTSVLIDDKDFDLVANHKWNLHRTGYVTGCVKGKSVSIHRLILGLPPREVDVDHINGDKLDNRRQNLRMRSHAENSKNRSKSNGKTSAYKGVSWDKVNKKWLVNIALNYKQIYLGRFNDEVEAANVYNNHAKKFHKNFAKLNAIDLVNN